MRSLVTLLLSCICLGCVFSDEGQTPKVKLVKVKVERVIDGDTIEVQMPNDEIEIVRYESINAPELRQPYYEEARKANERLVGDRIIWLEFNEQEGKRVRDRNRRLLAYAYLDPNGKQLVNALLVRDGWAKVDIRGVKNNTSPDDFRLKWIHQLIQLQINAVTNRRGWWSAQEFYPDSPLAIAFIQYWGNDEVVYIVNRSTKAINIAGWILRDRANQKVNLKLLLGDKPILKPGGVLRIHSGPAKGRRRRPVFHDNQIDAFWTGKYIWNNDGDEARLISPDGKVIYGYEYKGRSG